MPFKVFFTLRTLWLKTISLLNQELMMVSKLTRLVAVTFKYNFHTYYFFAKVVKNKNLPVWNRGGGATEELWERWIFN